jgi:hypothetical protein
VLSVQGETTAWCACPTWHPKTVSAYLATNGWPTARPAAKSSTNASPAEWASTSRQQMAPAPPAPNSTPTAIHAPTPNNAHNAKEAFSSEITSAKYALPTARPAKMRIVARDAWLATSGTIRSHSLNVTAVLISCPCAWIAHQGPLAPSARTTLSFCPTKTVNYAANKSKAAKFVKTSTNAANARTTTTSRTANAWLVQGQPPSSLCAWWQDWWPSAAWVCYLTYVGYIVFRKVKISKKKEERDQHKNTTLISEQSNEASASLVE